MVVELDIIGWSCKIILAVCPYRYFTVAIQTCPYTFLLQEKCTRVLYYRTVEAFKAVDPMLVSQLYQLYR